MNVSLLVGLGGVFKGVVYVVVKYVVVGVICIVVVEYGRKNVRVNVICLFYSLINIFNVDGYNMFEV